MALDVNAAAFHARSLRATSQLEGERLDDVPELCDSHFGRVQKLEIKENKN